MKRRVIELAQIQLAKGETEDDLVAASEAFQRGFLDGQDGFLSRDLVRRPNGGFLDIVRWESREQADAVFARAQTSQVAGKYFSVMQFDADDADPGVEHCPVVRSYRFV